MDTFKNLRELALFAGAGGGLLGGRLLDWQTVCAVEIEPYCAAILTQRQNDGLLPPFPVWDDVSTFNGHPWRGIVDVISGGFPCQDISIAGKGAGINGERSGLWREFARIVREVRPRYVFVENSPLLVKRGLTRVLRDLAEAGYDAAWTVLGADDVGAPHRRKRLWVLGKISDPASIGRETFGDKNGITPETLHQASAGQPCRADCDVSDSAHERNVRRNGQHGADEEAAIAGRDNRRGTQEDDRRKWWCIEPGLGRVADGVPNRVDRLKAIGNAQVPLVAATAFKLLFKQLNQPTR